MAIMLNTLLVQSEIDPSKVVLLRHQDNRADPGRSPYELWRDDGKSFEKYQAMQSPKNQTRLNRPYWLSFVATPQGETMFAGLYSVKYLGLNQTALPWPQVKNRSEPIGSCDCYDVVLENCLKDLSGRLFIDWGQGRMRQS